MTPIQLTAKGKIYGLVHENENQSEADILKNLKKEIWNKLDQMPWDHHLSLSIQITEEAFERMMTESEFKNEMLSVIGEGAKVLGMPITHLMICINKRGYSATSHNYNTGKEEFASHIGGKDSFYVIRADEKEDYIKLWKIREMEKDWKKKRSNSEQYMKSVEERKRKQKENAARLYDKNVTIM